MKTNSWTRVRSSFILIALAFSLVLVPQFARATPVGAQPATATLTTCGMVSGYTAAGAAGGASGSITISGGTAFPIVAGTTFTGSAAAQVANGTNLCFVLTLNASNQIVAGSVTANTPSTVMLCGVISAYTGAQMTPGGTNGSITIGARTFTIVANTAFTGAAAGLVANGANLCFSLTLNGAGQITAGTVTSNTIAYVTICGLVSAYMAAGAANGTITIGGATYTIVSGTTFTGSAAAAVANGANLCFQLTLNGANQIVAGNVTSNGGGTGTGTMQFCGVVTGFIGAGAGAGTLTIAGQTFTIVAGTTGAGVPITLGQGYCIVFTFNSSGQIVAYTVSQNLPGVSIVCGIFTTYTPAFGVTQSYIIVGGVSFLVNTTVFSPIYLVTQHVYCFLLNSSGVVIGLLSGVPTLAVPVEAQGAAAHRVGRLLAQ